MRMSTLRSGTAWDLHLIGYAAINTFGTMRPSVLGIPTWRFSAGRFLDVVAHIQREHAAGIANSDGAIAEGTAPWRYSGTADLVSFMAYRDLPGLIDWLSLRAVHAMRRRSTHRVIRCARRAAKSARAQGSAGFGGLALSGGQAVGWSWSGCTGWTVAGGWLVVSRA
jgi:hypothetical protein